MTLLHSYLTSSEEDGPNSSVIAYLAALDHLSDVCPEIRNSIVQELRDQRSHLKLIASENFSSLAVQLAMGNLLTDKYAEGYAHHRFYAGCENVDAVEDLASKELVDIFGCDHAYVQPHSGSDANLVAFWAILTHKVQSKEIERLGKKNLDELSEKEYEEVRQLLVNQRVLGMSLNAGGHLTHGYRHNISAKMMQAASYDVNPKTGLIDYKALEKQAIEFRPTILLAGYSSYPRRVNFAKMKEIADKSGAALMVDMAHFAGLVAGKVFQGEENPIPYADIVTSTTHKTLRGPRGGFVLCTKEYKDVVNKGCPLVLGGPLPHMIAAKAVAFREVNTSSFQKYAQKIVTNCKALADALLSHDIPLITGGTDNHLLVLDVTPFGLTGRHAELALREAGMTVNRNSIPFDPNGAWYTSGLRLGTAAITTLGMAEKEMKQIANLIVNVLKNTSPSIAKTGKPSKAQCTTDLVSLQKSQETILDLLGKFPLYPEIPQEITAEVAESVS